VLQGDRPAGGMQRGRSLVRTGSASERETEGRILPSPGSATLCGSGYRSDLATYHAIAGQPGRAPKHRARICHLRAAWRSAYRGGSTRYCTPKAVFIPLSPRPPPWRLSPRSCNPYPTLRPTTCRPVAGIYLRERSIAIAG
jgi:hypothetical protein